MSQNNNPPPVFDLSGIPEIGKPKAKTMIQPLFDRILVRPLKTGDRTKGGLYIPDAATEGTPWRRGEIVAMGAGLITAEGITLPMSVKVGDVVIFFRGGSDQLVLPTDDEDLLCIREGHILGIVHGLDRDTGLVGDNGRPLVVPS